MRCPKVTKSREKAGDPYKTKTTLLVLYSKISYLCMFDDINLLAFEVRVIFSNLEIHLSNRHVFILSLKSHATTAVSSIGISCMTMQQRRIFAG